MMPELHYHVTNDRRAACRTAPSTLFISAGDEVDDEPYPAAAAQVYCDGCVIRPDCLAQALADPGLVGVWGGTTTYQREQIRRVRARQHCPGCGSTEITTRLLGNGAVEHCLSCGVSWFTDDDK